MTDKQFANLRKLIESLGPGKGIDMDLHLHKKKEIKKTLRKIPKQFHRWHNHTGDIKYDCATASNVYGFSSIDISMYHPKEK